MEKEIKIAGKTIFYRVYGNGNPVMLVHGFGETGDVWKNQASLSRKPSGPSKGGTLTATQGGEDFIAKENKASQRNKYRLIVPDLPGSAKSEMINDMSMEGM